MAEALVGVIGGSGLYHLDNLTFVKKLELDTPWGRPSSPITIFALPSGTNVAFIARHGPHHMIPPSSVPSRANIAALKYLGVRAIIAFSAVGSLREEIAPGHVALPTQLIDRTKGIRPASFFEGTSVVAHAQFGDPVSVKFVKWLEERVQKALDDEGRGTVLHKDKTLVCMEGPQFSTRAESNMYRAWGGDLINMSALPEAKLAREAELSYAIIATATDYDSWRLESDAVTAHDVLQVLKQNAETSKHVAAYVLEELHHALEDNLLNEEVGGMRNSIMPRSDAQPEEDIHKLAFVLPEYFG